MPHSLHFELDLKLRALGGQENLKHAADRREPLSGSWIERGKAGW